MSSHSSCWLSPSSDQHRDCHETEGSFTDMPGQQHQLQRLELVLSHPTATLAPSRTHSTTPRPLAGSDRRQKHLPGQSRLSAEHCLLWAATGSQNSGQAMTTAWAQFLLSLSSRLVGLLHWYSGALVWIYAINGHFLLLSAVAFAVPGLKLYFRKW